MNHPGLVQDRARYAVRARVFGPYVLHTARALGPKPGSEHGWTHLQRLAQSHLVPSLVQ